VTVLLGLVSTVYFFSWWGEGGRVASPVLAILLVFAALFHWSQLLSSWVIYLAAGRRSAPVAVGPVPDTVDVFVTAYREPPELIERTLRAALAMRGPHRTWLLDDADDPRLQGLAERLGAGYLAREGNADAKAGNLNAALARTDGEIVVTFDADHAPREDFLERTLHRFADPEVGFVQVMLTFENERESWFARAAAESTADFFNPTSIGMDGLGSATLIGSNALFRRSALSSIGGYRPGLAEDLATSIGLHAAGWKSVYVAEPLAPGLAPAGARSWCIQQLKWGRGVFEVMLCDYFRLWPRLRWGQRFAYGVRTTYYWIGLVTVVHMGFTAAVLLGGRSVARVDMGQYLLRLLPLMLAAFSIRLAALHVWRHRDVAVRTQLRALMLVHSSWPLYLQAWLMAVVRLPLGFRLTPKSDQPRDLPLAWIGAQALGVAILAVAAALGWDGAYPLVTIFAATQALPGVECLRQIARATAARQAGATPAMVVGEPSTARR
jgi:cellulose synthase (UDP-forming)